MPCEVDLSLYSQQFPNVDEDVPAKVDRSPELLAAKSAIRALLPPAPELVAVTGNNQILDVGCGAGWGATQLQERYPHCTVAAITRFREEKALVTDTRILCLVEDMHKMPDEWTNSFGVVHASHVLEHSPAPYIALKEIHRVLARSGIAQVVMPNAAGHSGLGSARARRMGSMDGHPFCASSETVIEMARHAGLRFDSYHEIPQLCEDVLHYYHRVWMLSKEAS